MLAPGSAWKWGISLSGKNSTISTSTGSGIDSTTTVDKPHIIKKRATDDDTTAVNENQGTAFIDSVIIDVAMPSKPSKLKFKKSSKAASALQTKVPHHAPVCHVCPTEDIHHEEASRWWWDCCRLKPRYVQQPLIVLLWMLLCPINLVSWNLKRLPRLLKIVHYKTISLTVHMFAMFAQLRICKGYFCFCHCRDFHYRCSLYYWFECFYHGFWYCCDFDNNCS